MSDLSRLLAAAPPGGAQLLTGTVQTWDPAAGFTVTAGGTLLAVTNVLASVAAPSPGDVVAVLRYKSTVLILGTITAPS